MDFYSGRQRLAVGLIAVAGGLGGLWVSGAISSATPVPVGPAHATMSGQGNADNVGQLNATLQATPVAIASNESGSAAWELTPRASGGWALRALQLTSSQSVGDVTGDPSTLQVHGTTAWIVQPSTAGVTLAEYSTANGSRSGSIPVPGIDPKGPLFDAGSGNIMAVFGDSSGTKPEGAAVFVNSATRTSTTVSLAGSPTGLTEGRSDMYASADRATSTGPRTYLSTIVAGTAQVASTVQVPFSFEPETVAGSLVWGIESSTGQVLAVNPSSGVVKARIILSAGGNFVEARSLASSAASVWASARASKGSTRYLYRIDVANEDVLGRLNLGYVPLLSGAHGIALSSKRVWIAARTALLPVTRPVGS